MAKREADPATQIAQLERDLEDGAFPRGFVFKGEERYFAEKGLELVMKKASALSYEVSRHDAGDPDFNASLLMDDLSAAPMFATGRVIILRRAEKVLKGGKDAPLTRAINNWLANATEPGAVAICASTMRADHAVAKAVKKAGGPIVSCRKLWDGPPPWDPDPRKAENVQWLMRRASQMGVRLDSDRAVYIAAAIGNDLFALEGQVEKLKHSKSNDVRDVVEWQSGASPFALAEDLCRGDLRKSVHGIESLFKSGFQGSDGTRTLDRPALVAILLGSLRKIVSQGVHGAHVMSLGGDAKQAAKAAGVPPTERAMGAFQARMSIRPREDWSRLAQELLEVERRTRSGAEVDASDFCKLALSWKTAPARGRR